MTLYNLLTAFVTAGVAAFIAIYNTDFILVVTLGGTVLGSALLGFCSALLAFVLRKTARSCLLRCALEVVGCSCIIVSIAHFLQGWQLRFGLGSAIFLLLLCVLMAAINEFTLNETK